MRHPRHILISLDATTAVVELQSAQSDARPPEDGWLVALIDLRRPVPQSLLGRTFSWFHPPFKLQHCSIYIGPSVGRGFFRWHHELLRSTGTVAPCSSILSQPTAVERKKRPKTIFDFVVEDYTLGRLAAGSGVRESAVKPLGADGSRVLGLSPHDYENCSLLSSLVCQTSHLMPMISGLLDRFIPTFPQPNLLYAGGGGPILLGELCLHHGERIKTATLLEANCARIRLGARVNRWLRANSFLSFSMLHKPLNEADSTRDAFNIVLLPDCPSVPAKIWQKQTLLAAWASLGAGGILLLKEPKEPPARFEAFRRYYNRLMLRMFLKKSKSMKLLRPSPDQWSAGAAAISDAFLLVQKRG